MTRPTIICRVVYGSHLYGTNTPESDTDFKGVFLPTRRQALLGHIPRSWGPSTGRTKAAGEKNMPGDVDDEYFSLQEFVKLACEGQTVAIDMLHARADLWLERSEPWEVLVENRARFYTKNLKAFVGYARRQAAKYGIKGSRLATAKAVVEWLRANPGRRIVELIDPSGVPDAIVLHEHVTTTGDPHSPIEILGKRLTGGATTDHYLSTFERYMEAYGERAKLAEKNEGVDWKAVSHAVRAAIEVKMILTGQPLELPFHPGVAAFLRDIKQGKRPFTEVQQQLEEEIERIEELAAKSALPVNADKKWADEFVVRTMEEYNPPTGN